MNKFCGWVLFSWNFGCWEMRGQEKPPEAEPAAAAKGAEVIWLLVPTARQWQRDVGTEPTLHRPRLSLVCHSPGEGDLAGCCTWKLGLRQEGRCRINSRVEKTEQKLLRFSSSDKAPLQEGFPWTEITAACQSHLLALNQQVQAGEGAGMELLGFLLSALMIPDSQSPSGALFSQAAFRHSPASIRASQRSQGGDLWLTTAPACGQGVGSPQSPRAGFQPDPLTNTAATLSASCKS